MKKTVSKKKVSPHGQHRLFIALALMLLANLGWILPITTIPFLPLSLEKKALAATISLIIGHVLYNVGIILAGSHVVHLVKKHRQNIHFFWVQVGKFFKSVMKNIRKKIGH